MIFTPREDFSGTYDDFGEDEGNNNGEENFPPSNDFDGTNNYFPPSEDFNETDDDSGEDEPDSGEDTDIVDDDDLTSSDKHDTDEDNQSPTKFGDDNFNQRDDIPHSDEDTHSNDDDAIVNETQSKIVPMSKIKCRTIPYYINPTHSSYTRLVQKLFAQESKLYS